MKKKYIIIFLLLCLITISLFIQKKTHIFLYNITDKENYTSRNKSLRKGKKYLKQCLKGRLINKERFQISKNPKITIIIPLYNTGKSIKLIIRSIQNQNFLDIEIILVNDFSNDENITINIIQKLKIEDPRIVIINNKKNMGILYSRSIGVLHSKGKYIMNLDHDDFIFDRDVFDSVYKSAQNGNFDILSFSYVISDDNNFVVREPYYATIIPQNYIVTQPRLSKYPLFDNDMFQYYDFTIWAKLYKNLIYKKAVNFLSYKRYSVYNAYNEDLIGLFTICNVAEKYKYIRKFGVYHTNYIKSASRIAGVNKRIFDDIFFSEIILDLGKKQYKECAAIFLNERVFISNNKNNIYLLKVVNKILNCKYIKEIYKEKLKSKFKKLIKKKK